ncbi:MAG: hypothetical protein JW940_23175 [Polyangiaceae bacterium]|nr:hypothetical protein [Polyangiaceae bacterium]
MVWLFGGEQTLSGHLLTHAVKGALSSVAVLVAPTVPKKNIPSGPVTATTGVPLAGVSVMVASATVVELVGPSYRKPPLNTGLGAVWQPFSEQGWFTSFVTAGSLPGLCAAVFGRSVTLPDAVWQLVSLGLTYPALLLSYYVFWGMLRLRPLHVIWSTLTFTRWYSRRYHDPETRQKQMR